MKNTLFCRENMIKWCSLSERGNKNGKSGSIAYMTESQFGRSSALTRPCVHASNCSQK